MNLGYPNEERILLEFEEEELPANFDCCPYPRVCDHCGYVWDYMGEPIGPEMVNCNIVTKSKEPFRRYWYTPDEKWFLLVESPPNDPNTNRFYKGDGVSWNVGVRPPKAFYLNWASFQADFCFVHEIWKGGNGVQHHPTLTLDDLKPAEACYPSQFSEDTSDCPDQHRTPGATPALKWTVGAAVLECDDEECDGLIEPQIPQFKVAVISEDPEIHLNFAPIFTVCGPDEGEYCCPPGNHPCCLFPRIQITHPDEESGYVLTNPPSDPGYIYEGIIYVPHGQQTTFHRFHVRCYPNFDDEDQIIIVVQGEDYTDIHNNFGDVPGTVCDGVNNPEAGEVYEICVTCNNEPQ